MRRPAPHALCRSIVANVFLCALLLAREAGAYGPEGHLIAGRAAVPLLCARAGAEIAQLGGDEDLGEIGLWADRIRSNEAYADSAPWHYMNIEDGAELADYLVLPEGDVLWAIEHFASILGDRRLGDAERGEALRFLVHFVVDLHQPLHVGRAGDRGGNEIELRFRGEATNLHRLWDTQVIDLTGRTLASYTATVGRRAVGIEGGDRLDPRSWATESFALRPTVYAFGREGRELPDAYLELAAGLTETRLALAAARLARTLNRLLC